MSIALLAVFFFLLQLNVTYNSKLIREWREKTGIAKSAPERVLNAVGTPVRYLSRVFFGITSHPVFMDSHFNGYNHIIGVEAESAQGVKQWLPIIDKEGHAGWYLYGPVFVKWTFRVNSQHIKPDELENGLRDFTIFWAEKNGLDARKFKFNVYVKKIIVPRQWEEDFLRTQKKQPWIKAGEAFWDEHHQFTVKIGDIEAI